METLDRLCGGDTTKEETNENATMSDNTFLDYFYDNVEKMGDRVFMTQPMGNDKIKTWTFKETLADAKKMAGHIESMGIPAGSQIAI